MVRKSKKKFLKIIHPDCAGIDIGGSEHWVAVDPDRCDEPVQSFTSFTDDLERMADWLDSLSVKKVAMEATGVYWIPLFEVLDARGFEVYLVNSRSTRQVTGRKSDVLDCQWIWQLMSHGLLSGAFRPADAVCVLRATVRQRATKVEDQARSIQHMQKALTQMNIQLDNVVSNLTGKTGLSILRAIMDGERDPATLAKHRDRRLRASEETVARSLNGNWRKEHLFALAQVLAHYDFLEQQIAECDRTISEDLACLPVLADESEAQAKLSRTPHRSVSQQRELHRALTQVNGVDLAAIPTLGIDTVLVLTSEIGPDLSRFPTVAHFCSWIGLAPPTHIADLLIINSAAGVHRRVSGLVVGASRPPSGAPTRP